MAASPHLDFLLLSLGFLLRRPCVVNFIPDDDEAKGEQKAMVRTRRAHPKKKNEEQQQQKEGGAAFNLTAVLVLCL